MTNISDAVKRAEESYGPMNKGGGDWFKVSEGENRIRLMSELEPIAKHFNKAGYKGVCIGKENCPGCKEDNKPSIKFLCWVIDRKDETLKIAELPYTIVQAVQAYQESPEWTWEGFPMPYDITINAKNAGTTDVVYTVVGSPNKTAVDPKILEALAKESKPIELKEAIKMKKMKELGIVGKNDDATTQARPVAAYPTAEEEGIDASSIPF